MRTTQQLVHSRARIGQRFALFPLEGYPPSRLPTWPDAMVRVLAAPAMGAGFVQYLIDLPAGKSGHFKADDRTETFYYVLGGSGELVNEDRIQRSLKTGSFGLTPPDRGTSITADAPLSLLILRKRFEPVDGIMPFEGYYLNEAEVPAQPWADNPHSRLQTLIPDEFQYDLAMNIFSFDPGFGLPYVETHVMEHGALVLQGKGLYYLDDKWLEVEKDDFIWMGPYCPQSFYATGPSPAKYIYYKNVNRDVAL